MIGILAKRSLSIKVKYYEGQEQVYNIPANAFLTSDEMVKIPASEIILSFKKGEQKKVFAFGNDEMIRTLETGDYEADLEFKNPMSPFYVVSGGATTCDVYLFNSDTGELDTKDLDLEKGFFIGNVAEKNIEISVDPAEAKLNVQMYNAEGKAEGSAEDKSNFQLPANTAAYVKKAGDKEITKIKSKSGSSNAIHVKYYSAAGSPYYTSDKHQERTKIDIKFDDVKPDPEPETMTEEKTEPETESKEPEPEHRAEFVIDDAEKLHHCYLKKKGVMTVKFMKPYGCFALERDVAFKKITVQLFDGKNEVSKKAYEYDSKKPFRLADAGKYKMTVTVEAEDIFIATAHSIPVSFRVIGVTDAYNLEVEKGKPAEVILWSTVGTGYTWEVKGAVLNAIPVSALNDGSHVNSVRHIATATGDEIGSVSFKNPGQTSKDISSYTVSDKPKVQQDHNLVEDVAIKQPTDVGMIVGIVVGVVAAVAIIGVVAGLAIRKKACFSPKIESTSTP